MWRTDESELWFDIGTVVNLRIEAEKWVDQAPKAPTKNGGATGSGTGSGGEVVPERAVPYSIEVCPLNEGRGWWDYGRC